MQAQTDPNQPNIMSIVLQGKSIEEIAAYQKGMIVELDECLFPPESIADIVSKSFNLPPIDAALFVCEVKTATSDERNMWLGTFQQYFAEGKKLQASMSMIPPNPLDGGYAK